MTTLQTLAPRYDAVLSDVWGVVHDGVTAHPTAVEALRRFRAGGGSAWAVAAAKAASQGPSDQRAGGMRTQGRAPG